MCFLGRPPRQTGKTWMSPQPSSHLPCQPKTKLDPYLPDAHDHSVTPWADGHTLGLDVQLHNSLPTGGENMGCTLWRPCVGVPHVVETTAAQLSRKNCNL